MANSQFTETQRAVNSLNQELIALANTAERLAASNREVAATERELTTRTRANTTATEQLTRAQRNELEIERLRTDAGIEEIDTQVRLTEARRLAREEARNNNNITRQSSGFTQRLTQAYQASIIKIAAYTAAVKVLYEATKKFITGVIDAEKQTTRVAQTFAITRNEARKLAGEVRVVAGTFDQDFNNVLKSSRILSEEFGISGSNALNLIQEGFEKGADVNGEFLELLKEYPAQLKTVGLNAKESIALITQTERAGVFSDKGIDAIKEAGIRLRELTPATKSALNLIGLSGEKIQKELETGQKTLFEVTQEVSSRLSELPAESQAVGTAIADIFGGPGEDVGIRFLSTLKDIDLELDNVDNTMSQLEKSSLDLKSGWEEFKNTARDQEFYKDIVAGFGRIAEGAARALKAAGGFGLSLQSTSDAYFRDLKNKLLETKTEEDSLQVLLSKREAIYNNIRDAQAKLPDATNREARKLEKVIALNNTYLGSTNKIIEELKIQIKTEENLADTVVNAKSESYEKNKTLQEIQAKDLDDISAKNIERLQKEIEVKEALEKEYAKARAAEADKEFEAAVKLSDEELDLLIDDFDNKFKITQDAHAKASDSRIQEEQELEDAIENLKLQSALAAEKIVTDRVTAGIDNRLNATLEGLEAEEVLLQNQLDKGLITEAAYLNQIADLKLKARQEEAKAEKKKALFDIAIATLVEVAKAGFVTPLALAVGAAGLVTAAAVATEPIPAFFKGVENFEGGAAYVGEKGREIIDMPGHVPILSPDSKTLMNLPEGTNVVTNPKTEKILEKSKDSGLELKVLKSIDNKLSNQTSVTNNITRLGMSTMIKRGKTTENYINKYKRGW